MIRCQLHDLFLEQRPAERLLQDGLEIRVRVVGDGFFAVAAA
jgi:hypothetical protein